MDYEDLPNISDIIASGAVGQISNDEWLQVAALQIYLFATRPKDYNLDPMVTMFLRTLMAQASPDLILVTMRNVQAALEEEISTVAERGVEDIESFLKHKDKEE